MLGSYRGIFIAIAGLVLTGASPPKELASGAQPTQRIEPSASPTSDYTVYPDPKSDRCYNPNNHNAADLCAQWRGAVGVEEATEATWIGIGIDAAAALLSFVGIVLVLIALGQTNKSLRLAQKDRADATRRAIAQSEEAAAALAIARESNEISATSNERQQRAYVGIVEVSGEGVLEGHDPLFHVQFTNAGSTPARSLVSRGFVHLTTHDPETMKLGRVELVGSSVTNLMPGCSAWCSLRFGRRLSGAQMKALKSGSSKFVFAGYIIYRDIFGRRRYTLFRSVLTCEGLSDDGEAVFAATSRGNITT